MFSLWKRWRHRTAAPPDNPGETLSYLAAFIAAGLSPRSAWQEIPEDSLAEGPVAAIHRALGEEVPLARAIRDATVSASDPWRMLGATWSVARDAGAPLAPTLQALAHSMAERDHAQREITATMAGPLATMRLVMALPLLALGGSAVTGTPAVTVLFTTPLGLMALATASVLMGGAVWWMKILRREALPPPPSEELALELFSLATAGGALPEDAWSKVHVALEEYDLPGGGGVEGSTLTSLSRRVGVPVSGLARQRATMVRNRWRTDALESINALGVKVVIPLGTLVLPAFVLVAIVPMGLALWSGATSLALSTTHHFL